MREIKVIPCLDIKDGRVVKGVNFVDLKDQGDPAELAKRYVEEGADEIVFLDITATTEGRESTFDLVAKTAASINATFTVGGGVRSLEDAKKMVAAGADKVGINSAAINNPELLSEISSVLGSQKLVLAIDVKKTGNTTSGYEVVTHGGNNLTGIDAVDWAIKGADLGAGEILLTSMGTDGMQTGFDTDILAQITGAIKAPITASGGAGELQHFVDAASAGASAVLAASVFHTAKFSVGQVKEALVAAGFSVRGL